MLYPKIDWGRMELSTSVNQMSMSMSIINIVVLMMRKNIGVYIYAVNIY